MRSAAGSDAGPRTPRIVGLSPLLRPLEALGALGTLMEHAAASTRGRASRRAWVGHGRAHIEVRGLHRPGSEDLAASLKEALEHFRPVRGVEVNAALGRVVVAFDGEEVGLEGLVEVIEEVEELHRVHRERFPHDRPEHPADLEPLQRNLAAMAADVAALGMSMSARAIRAVPIRGELAALVSRPPEELLREGPEASLGSSLPRQIALRAVMTAAGATGAWLLARPTGRKRASTVGLAALVGTQLGQTLAAGRRSPLVVGTVLASGAALVLAVETPGVSRFFGCTPLGPAGWATAAGAATVATCASVALPWVASRMGGMLGTPERAGVGDFAAMGVTNSPYPGGAGTVGDGR